MSTNDLIHILANRAVSNGFIIDEENTKVLKCDCYFDKLKQQPFSSETGSSGWRRGGKRKKLKKEKSVKMVNKDKDKEDDAEFKSKSDDDESEEDKEDEEANESEDEEENSKKRKKM